ncbi:hypothetical protein [Enterovibrio paralichthyis]|uniref:hypothetical protein n=1 Tax=Enterovibrio paralichthyis TaxID=2853805 RepID=UPI001C43A6DE|nr:hypothetical protein [Enterovibrio paralichthyis]MBV7300230.1 hypothetical protein [Enterovibrio paralichthyis]
MYDPDMPEPKFVVSLQEFIDNAETTIKTAQTLGYRGVSFEVSLEAAQQIIDAAKQYQEPKFLGFPKSLVESFIANEAESELPHEVMDAYKRYMTAEQEGWETWETKEEFFIDEAYDQR